MSATSDMSFEDWIKIFIIAFGLQENATYIPKFVLSDYVEKNKQTNKQTHKNTTTTTITVEYSY